MPPRSSNTWSRCISQRHGALSLTHRRPLGHISSNLAGEEKTPPATPPSSDLLAHEPIAGATQTDGPERKSQGDAQIILPFTKKEEITNLTGRPEKVVLAGSALKEPNLLPIDDTSITNSRRSTPTAAHRREQRRPWRRRLDVVAQSKMEQGGRKARDVDTSPKATLFSMVRYRREGHQICRRRRQHRQPLQLR